MESPLIFADQLARRAGGLLSERFALSGVQARCKADHTVVTEADLAADRLITQAIQERYPQESILSEEARTRLDGDAPAIWVIDPLDGSTNFSLGLHLWGVSIARLVDGWTQTAALYFPLIGELYTAQRGLGARLNDRPIHTQAPAPEQPASFFSCCSRTFQHYEVDVPYKARILGSAAYTFCAVARGAALLGCEITPKVWDLAAAWLVAQEAGGVVETLDGSSPFPVKAGQDYNQHSYPTLVAATPELMDKAHQQIRPKHRAVSA